MAKYATVSREQAARQQAETPPAPPPGAVVIPEAPKSAAPGSHPGAPVESDSAALAEWQGQDRLEARKPSEFSWKQDAWGRPVLMPDPNSGSSRSRPAPENRLPEDTPAGKLPAEKPEQEARPRRGQ